MKMHTSSTVLALVAGLAAAMFVAGCVSSRRIAAADEQTHAYIEGMMCPKCETVWVTERERRGPRNVTRLIYSREMTCPDCDAMAQSRLLEDGSVMLHECRTCKITPLPVKPKEAESYYEPSG